MTWLKGVLMASPSACSKGGSLLMAIFKSLSACLKGCFLPMIPKYCLRSLRLALNMYNNFLDRMHNAYAYQLCIFGVDADIVFFTFHACTQGQLRVMLRVQQKKTLLGQVSSVYHSVPNRRAMGRCRNMSSICFSLNIEVSRPFIRSSESPTLATWLTVELGITAVT